MSDVLMSMLQKRMTCGAGEHSMSNICTDPNCAGKFEATKPVV